MKNKFFNLTNKSLQELEVNNHKELWDKIGKKYKGISCEIPVTFEKNEVKTKAGETETVYTMILSTDDEDRHGDIVKQDWDLKWFKKNPVLLDSHNYSSIEHIIGKLKNIRVEDNKLKAEIEFNLSNKKGIMAKEMVEGGFINANSVGFIPKEFDNNGNILKSELLEDSLVSVPANPRALFEKKIKEVKKEIEAIEIEIKETDSVTSKKLDALDKRQEILKSIKNSVTNIKEAEIRKQKRLIQIALRNL